MKIILKSNYKSSDKFEIMKRRSGKNMNLVRIRLVRQCLSLGAKCFIGSAQAASPIAIRESVSRKHQHLITPVYDSYSFPSGDGSYNL